MTAREQTTLRLPAELMERLRQQAQEREASLNEIILHFIHKGLESESRRFDSHNRLSPPS